MSEGDWMKCCEWAKGGIETASFTGNDMQRLIADQREERMFIFCFTELPLCHFFL
jgi:hypothetical protein